MMTRSGQVMHAGKGKDDVLEWVKRKRKKQVMRNQRRHREEILERKQLEKQKGIIAAIVISTALQDDDFRADQLRVVEALQEYDIQSRLNKTAAVQVLERKCVYVRSRGCLSMLAKMTIPTSRSASGTAVGLAI